MGRPHAVARRIAVLAAMLLVAGAFAAPQWRSTPARASANLARFSQVSNAQPPNLSPDQDRTPNGWLLRPAGTQIDTSRAPTGVTVSPDGSTVLAVNSGIFDDELQVIDAASLQRTLAPATDLYMGAAIDKDGNAWVSTGNRDRVYQYRLMGPAAVQVKGGPGLVPLSDPNNGIPVVGYPGNMVLGPNGRLFVAGNISVPSSFIKDKGGPECANSDICSVVNVIDVSDPFAGSPAVHYVPVGRDAYDVAVDAKTQKLYVSNWADDTNPARANGTGTVSVVDISTPGQEHEVQVVPVGRRPTGIALSPDGGSLFVTNSADDTLSKLSLDAATGTATAVSTIDVRTGPDAPLAATPLAVAFSPDGQLLYVAMAGQNAIQVRNADGSPIPRTVKAGTGKSTVKLTVPNTYIPTGWYPDAMAAGPDPNGGGSRLYVTNFQGMGAGPGLNGDAEPLNGSRTQGTLSAIDVPANLKSGQWNKWTATVVENNDWVPVLTAARDAAKDPCTPAPLPGGGTAFSQVLCDASRGAIDARQFHVVYVVKENKTFDQYFGDINGFGVPGANADPSWLLYGYPVTTNQHEIAKRWTLMDNFWSDADVSVTGHSWTSAGYATEANQITWNPEYANGIRGNRSGGQYDGDVFSNEKDPEVGRVEGRLVEPQVRLVDEFATAAKNPLGATYRIYSDDVNADSPAMANRISLNLWGIGASTIHHGRDLDFPDTDRAAVFLTGHTISHAWTFCGVPCTGPPNPPPSTYQKEIGLCGAPDPDPSDDYNGSLCSYDGAKPTDYQTYSLAAWTDRYKECIGNGGSDEQCQRAMPNFLYMALPIDHTLGFNPNTPTPASMVANNDLAFGQIVDALSHSPFWKNTLVIALEDDTQAAGDHVDAHRTFLLAAGGLARQYGAKGEASHQEASFPSVLKTVEVLFHIPAFTIYDRGAAPLHDVVVPTLADRNDLTYVAVTPDTPFERNPATGILARISAALNWNGVDLINEQVLNDLLYHHYLGWPLRQRDFAVLQDHH